MSHRQPIAAWAVVAMFSWTLVGCDGAIRIRGEAVDEMGRRYDDCLVMLYSHEGQARGTRITSGKFFESFLVDPWSSRTYYVTVACTGAIGPAKSQAFIGRSMDDYDRPVDLGRLTLPR